MALNIIVCIKQTPDPEHFSTIALDPATGNIIREGVPAVINPLDRRALEEAFRVRERFSGKVVALSMGPPQAREALETALAMGADEAILLCDRGFAGADTLATSLTLSLAIHKLGDFDLVLCGDETIDSGTGQVGPQLAEFLGIPDVSHVTQLDYIPETTNQKPETTYQKPETMNQGPETTDQGPQPRLVARCALERGYVKVEVTLPAVVTVAKEINEPRLTTVLGIMAAVQKGVITWDCAALGAEPGLCGAPASPTRVVGAFESKAARKKEILTGDPKEAARKAVARLRELGAVSQ